MFRTIQNGFFIVLVITITLLLLMGAGFVHAEEVEVCRLENSVVLFADFNGDNALILERGYGSFQIMECEVSTGVQLHSFTLPNYLGDVYHARYSPNEQMIVIADQDGRFYTLIGWQHLTEYNLHQLLGGYPFARDMVWADEETAYLIADQPHANDQITRLLITADYVSAEEIIDLGRLARPTRLALSEDGKWLAAQGSGLLVVDTAKGEIAHVQSGNYKWTGAVTFDPTGQYLLAEYDSIWITVIDTQTWKIVGSGQVKDGIREISVRRDGLVMVTNYQMGVVYLGVIEDMLFAAYDNFVPLTLTPTIILPEGEKHGMFTVGEVGDLQVVYLQPENGDRITSRVHEQEE
jgi:hypothetical protein